jgi:hypothetical protein
MHATWVIISNTFSILCLNDRSISRISHVIVCFYLPNGSRGNFNGSLVVFNHRILAGLAGAGPHVQWQVARTPVRCTSCRSPPVRGSGCQNDQRGHDGSSNNGTGTTTTLSCEEVPSSLSTSGFRSPFVVVVAPPFCAEDFLIWDSFEPVNQFTREYVNDLLDSALFLQFWGARKVGNGPYRFFSQLCY